MLRLTLTATLCLTTLLSCKKPGNEITFTDLTYGSHPRNKIDIYLPRQRDTTTAMILLIHGGGWVAGNKEDWSQEIINELLNSGYAVSSMNYQYANGNFHNQMQDISNAIAFMQTKSTSWKISSSKFALMGASAGAHLSLLYAHAYDNTHLVKTVVSIVGPTDMTDTLFHQYANNWLIGSVFEQFLGTTFQNNPQVYQDASPLYNFSTIPTFFISGWLDNLVPPQQSLRMFDSLTVHGTETDTTIFQNADHNVFGPANANKNQIYHEVKIWLGNYLH